MHFWLVVFLAIYLAPRAIDAVELWYSIEEELPVGTVIGNVVSDTNMTAGYSPEIRNILRFKFLTNLTINISIEQMTGDVITIARIDRETICRNTEENCIIRQSVVVHPIQYLRIIKVDVRILDINDNSPEFRPDRVVQEMIESSQIESSFVIPTARDADTAAYSVNRYELFDPNRMFQINVSRKMDGSSEVRLVLIRPLDRETKEEHRMTVFAFDAGDPPRSGSIDVTVVVLDSNDNVPVFEYTSYEVTITENEPLASTVAKVTARDRDVGLNSQVLYSFSPSTQTSFGNTFAINNVTGEIYVTGTVDYERTPVYHLIVSAIDMGQDAVAAETTVIVRVEDKNDNAPKITVNTLVAANTNVSDVLENSTLRTFVGHVVVFDADSGRNGRFNCSLMTTADGNFHLQQMSSSEYHVVTSAELDYERKRRYHVTIVCSDSGSPPLVSAKEIRVNVIDVNDNTPRCSPEVYKAEVLENNYVGVFVVQVNCTDDDSEVNDIKSYRLSSIADSYFNVDRLTGTITAIASLDRESISEHRFYVYVIDGGTNQRTGTASVVVLVLDVNDEIPGFVENSYSFEIEENQPSGSFVGLLSAEDNDEYPFNEFYFSLTTSESPTDAFVVNRMTGRITTTRTLDRETQDVYRMAAIVADSRGPSMTSSVQVTVCVLDTNDHSPVFIFPTVHNNTIQLTAAVTLEGQAVARVEARDGDERLNAEVGYSIAKGNDENVFILDSMTGILKSNVDLKSVNNTSFSLIISATDKAASPLTSYAYLNIVVHRQSIVREGGLLQAFASVSFNSRNFVPILVVCGVSAIVISVLLVAIFFVLCQQRQRGKESSRKYNCRKEALKVNQQHSTNDNFNPKKCNEKEQITENKNAEIASDLTEKFKAAVEVRIENGKAISRRCANVSDEKWNLNAITKYEAHSDFSSADSLATTTIASHHDQQQQQQQQNDAKFLRVDTKQSFHHQPLSSELSSNEMKRNEILCQTLTKRLRGCESNKSEVSSADSGRVSNFNEENNDDSSKTLMSSDRSLAFSTKNNTIRKAHYVGSSATSLFVGCSSSSSNTMTLPPVYNNVSSFKKICTSDNGQTSVAAQLVNSGSIVAYEICQYNSSFAASDDHLATHKNSSQVSVSISPLQSNNTKGGGRGGRDGSINRDETPNVFRRP